MPKKQHGRHRIPTREVPLHRARMSAVRERCECGELMTAAVHGPRPVHGVRLIFPPPVSEPALLQVGVDPDTAEGRRMVTNTLGWSWVDRVDDGVWNVRPVREWRTGGEFDATLTDGVTEVRITVEWP